MPNRSKYDQFVARADEAQKQADKAKDPEVEAHWRRIAANYRDLAMMAQYANRPKTRH
jgi:hypothetical protein